MARLTPFRALRPSPAVAARVSSVPYDVVSTAEARAAAEGEPLSFLRVTRSEIELADGADAYAAEVYDRARTNLGRLKADGVLATDAEPGLYVYRLTMGGHVQAGVAGCFSVDEYEGDRIKKHEKTRRDKEDDRTRHIVTLRAQTGVVFLTYRASDDVNRIVAGVTKSAPLYEFTAPDGVEHTVWRASADDRDALVRAFGHDGKVTRRFRRRHGARHAVAEGARRILGVDQPGLERPTQALHQRDRRDETGWPGANDRELQSR